MKRRFTFLVTALLLFAATGQVWAQSYLPVSYDPETGVFSLGTGIAGEYVAVTVSANVVTVNNGSGNTNLTIAAVSSPETADEAAIVAKIVAGTVDNSPVAADVTFVYKLAGSPLEATLVKLGQVNAVAPGIAASVTSIPAAQHLSPQ